MRRAIATLGLLMAFGAGISLSVLPSKSGPVVTKGEQTYLIPQGDGYGVAECISSGKECGKIVANAWCESKGHERSLAFGLAEREDFTGNVGNASGTIGDELPLKITCGE